MMLIDWETSISERRAQPGAPDRLVGGRRTWLTAPCRPCSPLVALEHHAQPSGLRRRRARRPAAVAAGGPRRPAPSPIDWTDGGRWCSSTWVASWSSARWTLVVAAGSQRLWMLCAVAFALGVGGTLFDTAGPVDPPRTSYTMHGQLERANSRLYAVELTANQFVGQAVGGLSSPASALAAGVGTQHRRLPARRRRRSRRSSAPSGPDRTGPATATPAIRRDIAEGLRYLARHHLLRSLAVVVGISNLASSVGLRRVPAVRGGTRPDGPRRRPGSGCSWPPWRPDRSAGRSSPVR